jgi:acyl-CoA thioester hydrolase
MRILIRWDDMDAMNQVSNTGYSRYLEVCEIDWMYSIGFVPDAAGEGPVIVTTVAISTSSSTARVICS